jgi:hypothetical protein
LRLRTCLWGYNHVLAILTIVFNDLQGVIRLGSARVIRQKEEPVWRDTTYEA